MLCLVAQSCPTLWDPVDCSPPGSSGYGDSLGKNTGVGCHPLLKRISQSRDRTLVSCIAGGFFTVWATREPKNTGVVCHALLQGVFPTQGSNARLLFPALAGGVFVFLFFFSTSATWEAQFWFWALHKLNLWASLFKSEINKSAFTAYNNYWFIVSKVRQILFLKSCCLRHLLSM